VAALFSALCLALAALARSSKEGQYYLMPLILVTMPLMILPMSPGIEINLGNSLIPITGLILLLRSMIEGSYMTALTYLAPVVGVTLVCCLLAIRWAVEQFNKESVLFRESERLDLGRWIVHLVRDRRDTPSVAEALACVVLIFIVQFFVNLAMARASLTEYRDIVAAIFISQVVVILLPTLLMTLLLTRRPLATLLLDRMPRLSFVGMAVLLAVAFHPVGQQLGVWIQRLYPPSEELAFHLNQFIEVLLESSRHPWMPFLLIALLPAICEELTFRGFVLSGLRHLGHKWWAIGLSAVFFGLVHSIVQQSLAAMAVGVVIGIIAVQTGSILPCVLFHATYNSLSLIPAKLLTSPAWQETYDHLPVLKILFDPARAAEGEGLYHWTAVAAGSVVTLAILWWFGRLPYRFTAEEKLASDRERNSQDSSSRATHVSAYKSLPGND
jgi:sodium transport system permease protein